MKSTRKSAKSLLGTAHWIPPAWRTWLSFTILPFPSKGTLWSAVCPHRRKTKSCQSSALFVCMILPEGQAESTHNMEHQSACCRCSAQNAGMQSCAQQHGNTSQARALGSVWDNLGIDAALQIWLKPRSESVLPLRAFVQQEPAPK